MTYLHLDKRQIFLDLVTLALQRFSVFPGYNFVANYCRGVVKMLSSGAE